MLASLAIIGLRKALRHSAALLTRIQPVLARENHLAFLYYIIKPLVPTTPSYIKDSSHIIALLEQTHFWPDALLVTINVSSLYTNLPQDEGTDACLETIGLSEASHIPPSILLELFNIVLKCSVFSFDNSIHQQIHLAIINLLIKLQKRYALTIIFVIEAISYV